MESNKINNSGNFVSKIRPVSPHLSIYKPQLTSTLSIFHRITGSILALTLIGFVLLYKLYNYYSTSYPLYSLFETLNEGSNWLIASIFFLLLFSFFYHTCNGMRHLMWDFGYGLDLKNVYLSGYIVIVLSFVLTIIVWIIPGLI